MSTGQFAGFNALVVEDKEFPRRGYIATLKAHGFKAAAAAGVDDAKHRIDREFFELAWIDLGLQRGEIFTGREGKEVVEYIRRKRDPTYIMIVTVIDDANTANELITEIGADSYITKAKIETASWIDIFNKIDRGLKQYSARRDFDKNASLRRLFPDGDDFFLSDLTRITGLNIGANNMLDMLGRTLSRVHPFIIESGKETFRADGKVLKAQIWSRKFGNAVEIIAGRPQDFSKELPGDELFLFERKGIQFLARTSQLSFSAFEGA